MQRLIVSPRPDKAAKLESIGLSFHDWDNYWKEEVCYKFTSEQVDVLEEATNNLHQMCLVAVRNVIDNNRFAELGIPEAYWEPIKKSWQDNEPSLYGRFDLAYDGLTPPKMLEYNADTPTSLLESAVAQWYWLQDKFPESDQFNSLHERLVDRWEVLAGDVKTIHFASINDNEEDWVCAHYMMETAVQAGYEAKHVFVEALGVDHVNNIFVDGDNQPIEMLFKLYPWEWLMREDFGQYIAGSNTQFIEPMWKSILSNKGILAILWELFPGHENLLAAYFAPDKLEDYAKKPFYSREGANIELYQVGIKVASDDGPYGSEGYVYQDLYKLPSMGGKYPIIGSWVVSDESAGMCMREDDMKITTNMSNFVPHYFE